MNKKQQHGSQWKGKNEREIKQSFWIEERRGT